MKRARQQRRRALPLAALGVVAAVACGTDGDRAEAATPDDPAIAEHDARSDVAARDATNAADAVDGRPVPPGPVTLARVFPNVALASPMMIAQAPGDPTRWFVAQRAGTIVAFPTASPPAAPPVVADLGALAGAVYAEDEGGLLALAFHPKFGVNGRLYVSWTSVAESILGVLTSNDGGQSFTGYQTILSFPRGSEHHGGGLAFGKDGLLYASFGDGGRVERGQTTTGFDGKVLRIDVDTPPPVGATYVIPSGNPFRAGGGEPATFARGFRNPWRLSVDRATGDVWLGDVGRAMFEEVDRVTLGGNYGWPCREGAQPTTPPEIDPSECTATMLDPVTSLTRAEGWSITGGVVYRGSALAGFTGTYVFGDFGSTALYAVARDPDTGTQVRRQISGIPQGHWVSFAEDVAGEIYAVSYGSAGELYQLVPAAP